jgi:hypothetical protein
MVHLSVTRCYFVSQSNDFCRHNPLCCFLTSVYCCLFRYWLNPETFGYTIVNRIYQGEDWVRTWSCEVRKLRCATMNFRYRSSESLSVCMSVFPSLSKAPCRRYTYILYCAFCPLIPLCFAFIFIAIPLFSVLAHLPPPPKIPLLNG